MSPKIFTTGVWKVDAAPRADGAHVRFTVMGDDLTDAHAVAYAYMTITGQLAETHEIVSMERTNQIHGAR
jgi:hypothetical protein